MADPQEKARAEVRRAQAEFEQTLSKHEKSRESRRKSFERARAAGLSLAEIGKVANLHRSRVDQILRGN